MSENVEVEAARIPDRDRLLQELRESGLDARPVDELGIEVPVEVGRDALVDELFAHAESVIMSIGAPFSCPSRTRARSTSGRRRLALEQGRLALRPTPTHSVARP